MGKIALNNVEVLLAGYALTRSINACRIETSDSLQPATCMGAAAEERVVGIPSALVSIAGLFDAGVGEVNQVAWAARRLDGRLLTVTPAGGALGDLAWFLSVVEGSYNPIDGGRVGQPHGFTLEAMSSGEAANPGIVLGRTLAAGATLQAASGDGTAYQLGAVGASQRVWGALHVLHAEGTSPTLDLIVESDDEEAFAGSPSTRMTFAQQTAAGGFELLSAAGAIADDWWRGSWTIGGTDDPKFRFALAVGIY